MNLNVILSGGFSIIYKEQEKKISAKEVTLIYRGIRPKGIDKELFKSISRELKKFLKEYKRGELIHLAKMSPSLWESLGGKKGLQKGATYIKENVKT